MSKGFLRWIVKDAHKSASTYGMLITAVGFAATVGGCPQPIPFLLIAGGIVINMCDAIYAYIKYQKFVYDLEQERVVRGLKQQ